MYQNDLVNSLSVPLEQADILSVDDAGIRPTFYRRNINVAPTATEFQYSDLVRAGGSMVSGGAKALSNDANALKAIDGDLSTYWEPETPVDFDVENLRKWELEIDLGRLVYIDSVTVIFPAGEKVVQSPELQVQEKDEGNSYHGAG